MDGAPKNYDLMDFNRLEADPDAGPVLQRMALEYLLTDDRVYFEKFFTGDLDKDSYLIRKDEQKPNTKPSQNIGGGLAMLEVTRMTKENLRRRSGK